MSEAYLYGIDTLQSIPTGAIAAQIFRPLETHQVWFVDLEVWSLGIVSFPEITINSVLFDGTPSDTVLFTTRGFIRTIWKHFGRIRIRYTMRGGTVLKGIDYALLAYGHINPLMPVEVWMYDSADAQYPRGYRCFKPSPSDPWQKYELDDHGFAVFGEPPVPKGPPDPPVLNFTILDLKYHPTLTGYILHVTTSVPCHLYMIYTLSPPDKHKESIIIRGLPTKDALRYCFVNWTVNEQEELGDTIYHTFIKEPWPYCQNRWFTFRSTVDEIWSPSVGPIFWKHMAEVPYDMLILEPWTYLETSPPPFILLLEEPWTS